jgi:hypothetical protein
MRRHAHLVLLVGVIASLSHTASLPVAAQANPPRILSFLESVKGTEEVELRWPVAVAAASAEEIAVADAFGPRLLRFRRVGVSWQFYGAVPMSAVPVGLTWDGRRYVATLRQGMGLVAFEGSELVQRRLPLPRGVVPGAVAAFPNGDLLLYDYAGDRVLRLSADGDLVGEIPIEGDVTAVAASPAGGIFTAIGPKGSVLHFDAAGQLDATWNLPESDKVPAWPAGLALEPGGDLLVVDRHNGRLLVLDANGQVVGLGSRQGWEPGLLLLPRGVARLPNGLVLVADEGNGRAQIFRRTD